MSVAFHEAGHAVMAISLGIPLERVSIRPSRRGPGRVWYTEAYSEAFDRILLSGRSSGQRRAWIERDTLASWAGPEAQRIATGKTACRGWRGDMRAVAEMAALLSDDPMARLWFIERSRDKAAAILLRPWIWAQVKALASTLIRERELSGEAARLICVAAVAAMDRGSSHIPEVS